MKLFFSILAFLSLLLIGLATYFFLTGDQQTIVERSSPEKSWRIEILGRKKLSGMIEVSANVFTADGRVISKGVISLCDSWKEAEYTYKVSATDKLMIDEVKATVDGRLLIRDHYFPDEEHSVNGKIDDIEIELPIGEVTAVGFTFSDGTSPGGNSSLRILPTELPTDLQPGFTIELSPDDPIPQAAFVNLSWKIDPKEPLKSASLSGKSHTKLLITEVSEHVVEGAITVISEDPVVRLAGNFRIVNHLNNHPDIPLSTELVH